MGQRTSAPRANANLFEALEGRVLMAAPSNDDFADARGLRGSSVVVDGTTSQATTERGEAKVGFSDANSVWFSWKAPANGGVAVYLEHEYEPPFMGYVRVFRGKTLTTLKNVGSFFGWGGEEFVAKAGVRYHILVGSPPDRTGDFTLGLESGLPKVEILAMDAIARETRGGEPADTASLLVTRTGSTKHPLRLRYYTSTLSGHARRRKDYKGLSGIVTIPAGSKSAVIIVKPVDDAAKEPSEAVSISPTTGLYDYISLDSSAEVRILDND